MISIVVPAHNEARVIDRCLKTMLEGARPDEFEILVVCNGCTDDTAERARRFGGPVRVIETPVGSKSHALNLGDQQATSFPRFYVDADVQLTTAAIRDVAALLSDGSSIVVATPQPIVECSDRPWFVRSYYRVWTQLPYFMENMIGSGVYAFSREGRGRFGDWPTILADDEFARLVAGPEERRASRSSSFTIHPPRTLDGLLKITTRARVARHQLRERFPDLHARRNTSAARTMSALAKNPNLWLDAPVYLGITLLGVMRAHAQRRKGRTTTWARDDSSRQ